MNGAKIRRESRAFHMISWRFVYVARENLLYLHVLQV